MTKLFLSFSFLLVLASLSFAQKPVRSAEDRAITTIKFIAKEINLSKDQIAKLTAITTELNQKVDPLKEQISAADDKKALRAEMKTHTDKYNADLKTILTAEQFTQYEAYEVKRKEEMAKKRAAAGN